MGFKDETEKKVALSPKERLVAAHLVTISGADQHAVAGAFGVNPGRVNEAVKAIRLAMDDPMAVLRAMRELAD